MSCITKLYTKEKLTKYPSPVGKKYKEEMFLCSNFPVVVFYVMENVDVHEAENIVQKSSNIKDKPNVEICNKIPFSHDPILHRRMLAIHTSQAITLSILPFDGSLPVYSSLKNYDIKANSLLMLSKALMGFTCQDSKQIRFALGNTNIEDLGDIVKNINMQKPISVNCQIGNLISLGYQNLKDWSTASPNHVYVGGRPSVFVNKSRVNIKKSEFAAPKELLKAHVSTDEFEKEYELKLLEDIKNGKIIIENYAGKHLGCWCNSCGSKCNCKIIIQLFIEMSFRKIFHLM